LGIRTSTTTSMISQLNVNKRSIGVTFNANREAEVALWAPWATTAAIKLYLYSVTLPLAKQEGGYWTTTVDQLKPGDLYSFVLDGFDVYADPASLSQPQGLYGPSQAVHTDTFYWEETCWVNPPVDEYVIHEIDISTFSPAGTLNAIISHLAELKHQGVNAISVKPVTPFVNAAQEPTANQYLFAVPPSFGGYRELQHLVNACHYEGIAVILDINYDTTYHQQIEFASADEQYQARRHYVIENALMWFRDFHIDAIQLKAGQTLADTLALVTAIRDCANALTAKNGHHYYLLMEKEPVSDQIMRAYRTDCVYDDQYAKALQELFHKNTETATGRLANIG